MPRTASPRACLVFALFAIGLTVSRNAAATPGQAPRQLPEPETMTAAQKLDHQRSTAYQIKYETIWAGARAQLREARERAELVRRARHGNRAAMRALRVRRAENEEGPLPGDLPVGTVPPSAQSSPLAALGTQAVPTNVRCNNPAGDGTSAAQSEEAVAAIGNNIVVAWNDGQGFVTGGDVQGFGWSNDGGATFTDGGSPPHPPGFPAFRWSSDPVMTINEKTGDFWYCGLCYPDGAPGAPAFGLQNAIAVARGRFTAGVFAFDSVFVVRRVPNASMFLDKQWVACDSATGNVYVTNTTFGALDTIDFYRSVDAGRTWSAPLTLSSNTDAGNVQGSRVTVAPNGDVEVTWYAAQATTDEDAIRYRSSTNRGASFFSEVTPTTFYQQFGTGAPGFNRNRGVNFPSITVDHSTGPHRGRTYIAWQETYHFLATVLPPVGATTANEVEPNGVGGSATPFAPGQTLSGTLATTGSVRDLDYWSVALAAGQSVIFLTQPTPSTSAWTMRLYAPDANQMLCFGGNSDSTATFSPAAYYTFTAPVSGTYFLRMAASSWQTITYKVYTAIGVHGAERGRDQRDGFVAWSDNGVTWSTPARINDDAVGYDLYLPEVAVGVDGSAYTTWFDHRDDTYGSRANVYMSRSTDGGASWVANQLITSAQSNFTVCPTNIAPNMGDYSHLTSSGTAIIPVWADGRGAVSVDVWSTTIPVTSGITACATDTTMAAPATATRGWTLANNNLLFGGNYGVTLTSQRAWPMPAPATVAIGAASTVLYGGDVTVPDTAATGTNRICLTLTTPGGVVAAQCCYTLSVQGQLLAVGGGPAGPLALARSRPNPTAGPTAIAFTLPRAGHARLTVYDLAGARVRTLLDGERAAGESSITWDGRDERGAVVRAGAYFYRLEFGGQTLNQRLVMMR